MAPEVERQGSVPERESRLHRVNLQLMRLVLRLPGTDQWMQEDAVMYEVLREVLADHDLAVAVWLRCRSGKMTNVTWKYLNWIRGDLRRATPAPTADLQGTEVNRTPGPDLLVMVGDLGGAIRRALPERERVVFDAWVLSGNRQGWQRALALDQGKSDAWVSARLKRLKERLAITHQIAHPEEFVEELARLETGEGDWPDPASAGPSAQVAEPDADDAPLAANRDRLVSAYQAESREGQYIREMAAGVPGDEVRAAFPDEDALLLALHEQYWRVARDNRGGTITYSPQPQPENQPEGVEP